MSATLMPISLFSSSSTETDFGHALLLTVGLSLIAFLVTGGALAGFLRSLSIESREGRIVVGRRSRIWLAILIASILIFSGVITLVAIS